MEKPGLTIITLWLSKSDLTESIYSYLVGASNNELIKDIVAYSKSIV